MKAELQIGAIASGRVRKGSPVGTGIPIRAALFGRLSGRFRRRAAQHPRPGIVSIVASPSGQRTGGAIPSGRVAPYWWSQ